MLTIANAHGPDGKPPVIDSKKMAYVSYFENFYGEQMIFAVKKGTTKALLYHGDCGWDPMEVKQAHKNGAWVLFRGGGVVGHLGHFGMNGPEQLFITACMHATEFIRNGRDRDHSTPPVLVSAIQAEVLKTFGVVEPEEQAPSP